VWTNREFTVTAAEVCRNKAGGDVAENRTQAGSDPPPERADQQGAHVHLRGPGAVRYQPSLPVTRASFGSWLRHMVEVAGCVRPMKVTLPEERELIITKQILVWEIEMIRLASSRFNVCRVCLDIIIKFSEYMQNLVLQYEVHTVYLVEN